MILIEELKDINNVGDIAKLHNKAFPNFFLTQLGLPFLSALYHGYFEDDKSGILIAKENDKLYGFLAYSNDYPRFFKQLIKKHILKFAFCSLKAAVLHPSFIRRILGAFKKSNSVVKPQKYVELASICVDPKHENKGIGSALIKELINITDFSVYDFISLETDAENNDSANQFYLKNGFSLLTTYKTKEGRLMNEYIYKPGE
ncbi:MAG: GNAT family N-acetyltransferase [Clostridia bacterium]|nr:GNAT family N-acetyltransferase [Clostridia bacterium]